MFRIGFILACSIALVGVCLLARPSATYYQVEPVKYAATTNTNQEQIEMIGRYLAKWSDLHEKTISINGKPINIVDSTEYSLVASMEGGDGLNCITHKNVVFQSEDISGEQNEAMRRNIEEAINRGFCNKRLLTKYLDEIKDVRNMTRIEPERLAADLSCLGVIEFRSVWE